MTRVNAAAAADAMASMSDEGRRSTRRALRRAGWSGAGRGGAGANENQMGWGRHLPASVCSRCTLFANRTAGERAKRHRQLFSSRPRDRLQLLHAQHASDTRPPCKAHITCLALHTPATHHPVGVRQPCLCHSPHLPPPPSTSAPPARHPLARHLRGTSE